MAIPDERLYEYAVVRYVPRVDREEFINIGLIMMCKRKKWLRGEVRIEEDRLTAFDPGVNLELLKKQAMLFTRTDVPRADIPVEERYRWLAAVKSAVLQVSPSHPGLLDADSEPDSEFRRLFGDLVECRKTN